jgi:hypothetical protein
VQAKIALQDLVPVLRDQQQPLGLRAPRPLKFLQYALCLAAQFNRGLECALYNPAFLRVIHLLLASHDRVSRARLPN